MSKLFKADDNIFTASLRGVHGSVRLFNCIFKSFAKVQLPYTYTNCGRKIFIFAYFLSDCFSDITGDFVTDTRKQYDKFIASPPYGNITWSNSVL